MAAVLKLIQQVYRLYCILLGLCGGHRHKSRINIVSQIISIRLLRDSDNLKNI